MSGFMKERITEDCGEGFAPSRYSLKSHNDAIIKPYGTYDLFYEITFCVLQKLGAYEDIGTPEECRKAMEIIKSGATATKGKNGGRGNGNDTRRC